MTENPLRAALERIAGNLDEDGDPIIMRASEMEQIARAALAAPVETAPEQTAKPRHYVDTIAAHNSEMCCRLGITMGHLRDDGSRELECILERLDRAQKQIAQQAAPEQATGEFRIDLENGKYTYIRHANGQQEALRYGEPWRDLAGDKFVYLLAARIEELAPSVAQQRDESKEMK